ncbi:MULTISPECIES: SSI family serine proteinase inhibitor [unclassified Actinomadura]|uniref:SSI family serine proteinase inhibitor n=1 Tax=unclassified Actinomadura TaxID=2626254 RepID=UPI0011F024EB|nr:SSI family serine proteinase inhibitor [Actinomadura sp. K4S16]
MRTALGAVTLAFGTVAALAVPANAAAVTQLTVSIAPDISTGPAAKSVTLECEPTGGTHPDAEAACADLIKAGGDFRKIPRVPGATCPQYYDPVTASVVGRWRGMFISTSARYINAACANVETGGHVFHF